MQFDDVDDTNHSARVKAQGATTKAAARPTPRATFRIEPADIGSRVFIHTDLMLSGAVAQYGRGVGMIQATAAQIIGQFASNLRAQLERQPAAATPDVPSPPIVPERISRAAAHCANAGKRSAIAATGNAAASGGETDIGPLADRPRHLATGARSVQRPTKIRYHSRGISEGPWHSAKRSGGTAAFLVAHRSACAAGVEDFYKGRNVTLVIGYSVGGGYDAYARLLGRYFGKHVPGNPAIVPQQMTGAGSLRSANFIYSVAAKDGSVFGTFSRSMGISPLIDKAEFDSRKFTWLGSVTDDNTICVTWNTSPIKNWDDFLTKPSKFGGEGAGSDPDIWTLLYKNVFGAKARLVSGYPGTNDIVLAMERGEVDGLCGISWSTIKTRHPEWLTSHSVNIIVQAALKKEPEFRRCRSRPI